MVDQTRRSFLATLLSSVVAKPASGVDSIDLGFGSGDYIDVSSVGLTLGTDDFTFERWLRIEGTDQWGNVITETIYAGKPSKFPFTVARFIDEVISSPPLATGDIIVEQENTTQDQDKRDSITPSLSTARFKEQVDLALDANNQDHDVVLAVADHLFDVKSVECVETDQGHRMVITAGNIIGFATEDVGEDEEEMTTKAPTIEKPEDTDELIRHILSAADIIPPQATNAWTVDGKPKVEFLEPILSYNITEAERDLAWEHRPKEESTETTEESAGAEEDNYNEQETQRIAEQSEA